MKKTFSDDLKSPKVQREIIDEVKTLSAVPGLATALFTAKLAGSAESTERRRMAGTDSRHKDSRVNKVAARSLYASRQWKSQKEAACSIAGELGIKVKTAQNWVAEFRSESK